VCDQAYLQILMIPPVHIHDLLFFHYIVLCTALPLDGVYYIALIFFSVVLATFLFLSLGVSGGVDFLASIWRGGKCSEPGALHALSIQLGSLASLSEKGL